MEMKYFRRYGYLNWLEPEKVSEYGWQLVSKAYSTDEIMYDIVEKEDDIRYTKM